MKKMKYYMAGLCLAVFTYACQKTETTGLKSTKTTTTTANSALVGKWQIVSTTPFDTLDKFAGKTKYIQIKSDNTYYTLYEDAQFGYHRMDSVLALITSTQIGGGNGTSNYTISNDTLRIYNKTTSLVAIKSTTAPDYSTWITAAVILDKFSLTKSFFDIAWDGNYIVGAINGFSDNNLYRINTNSRKQQDSVFVKGGSPGSLAAVGNGGGYTWVSNGVSFYKLNANDSILANGAINNHGSNYIQGIAVDGQNSIWCSAGSDFYGPGGANVLYQYAISTAVTTQVNVGFLNYIGGIEYAAGYLYLVEYSSHNDVLIHKCTPSPFKAVTTYAVNLSNVKVNGIAFDGSNFWLNTSTSAPASPQLYKIKLQ